MKKSNEPVKPLDEAELAIRRDLGRRTRRGFVWGGVASLSGFAGWRWLTASQPEGLMSWPLRRVLQFDEKVGRAVFSFYRLARTFPASMARMPRVNGPVGINLALDLESWRLQVTGPSGSRSLKLADIQALPRYEMTTELKCIEGWSEVVTWAGARMSDLAETTGLATRDGKRADPRVAASDHLPYVSLQTPDKKYYVGLDIASAFHPQTLLCYEMNGAPLTRDHGAPLRLAIPVKYGIKALKQIGTIQFTATQPADYWAEKGYDWYSGH